MRPPPTPGGNVARSRFMGSHSAPPPTVRSSNLLGIKAQNVNPFDRRGQLCASARMSKSRSVLGAGGGSGGLVTPSFVSYGEKRAARAPLARVPLNVARTAPNAKKHALGPNGQRPSKRFCASAAKAMPPPPPSTSRLGAALLQPRLTTGRESAAVAPIQLGRSQSFVEMNRAEPSRDSQAWAWGGSAAASLTRASSGDLASSLPIRPTTSRFLTDYSVIGTLGGGEFGIVYECLNRLDGCPYAVKRTKARVRGASQLQETLKEVYALSAIEAPMAESATPTAREMAALRANRGRNAFAPVPLVRTESEIGLRATEELELDRAGLQHIVRYFSAWEEDEHIYIQMELCSGCASEFLLNADGSRPPSSGSCNTRGGSRSAAESVRRLERPLGQSRNRVGSSGSFGGGYDSAAPRSRAGTDSSLGSNGSGGDMGLPLDRPHSRGASFSNEPAAPGAAGAGTSFAHFMAMQDAGRSRGASSSSAGAGATTPAMAAQQLSSMDLGSEEEEDMEGAVVLGGEQFPSNHGAMSIGSLSVLGGGTAGVMDTQRADGACTPSEFSLGAPVPSAFAVAAFTHGAPGGAPPPSASAAAAMGRDSALPASALSHASSFTSTPGSSAFSTYTRGVAMPPLSVRTARSPVPIARRPSLSGIASLRPRSRTSSAASPLGGFMSLPCTPRAFAGDTTPHAGRSDTRSMTPKPTYPNLSESQLLAMLRHVLLALRLLHRKKLAHLDVKPGNIFWRGDLYKLGDFGMVTKVGVPGNEWDVEGDSCYLAPEVMKFRCPEDAARADLRKADIFGLGATVFAVIVRRELPQSGPLWHELRQNRDLSELERMLTAASSQQELLQQQQLRRAAQRSSSASDLMEEDGDAAIDGVQAFARHALGAGQRPASASAAAAGGMAALSDEFKALLQSMVRANPAERPCVEELLGSKLLCSAKDRQLTEAQERASALEAEVAELRAKLGSAQTQTQTQTQDIQK